ncbi:MAG: DUF1775 domain-containing protein [Gemmatimonadetes bacterium]|nr:DUF1775 domain-containing protein [Gemmatimonadota bacterium]
MRPLHRLALGGILCAAIAPHAAAQVAMHPPSIKPTAWERFALRAINQTDTAFVHVRLAVPEALMILGIEPMDGWDFALTPSTDSTPQVIEWSGGTLLRGEFREFVFYGRLPGDAREQDLVFPVRLTRANGSEVIWDPRSDTGIPPTVRIIGTTTITGWGSLALAGVAVGIAVIALALTVSRRRES